MIDPQAFLLGYIDCALWSSSDDEDVPLDEIYDLDDIATETMEAMRKDCDDFVLANAADLENIDSWSSGHDLWLTRNGHGAGYWDRGLGEVGQRLTEAAYALRPVDLYVGYGGLIYGG